MKFTKEQYRKLAIELIDALEDEVRFCQQNELEVSVISLKLLERYEVKKIKGLDDKQIKQTLGLTNKQLKNKKHSFSNNNISSLIDELSNEIPTLMITITGIIHYRNNPITITKNSFSYKGIMLRGNLFVETGPICLKGGNITF